MYRPSKRSFCVWSVAPTNLCIAQVIVRRCVSPSNVAPTKVCIAQVRSSTNQPTKVLCIVQPSVSPSKRDVPPEIGLCSPSWCISRPTAVRPRGKCIVNQEVSAQHRYQYRRKQCITHEAHAWSTADTVCWLLISTWADIISPRLWSHHVEFP